MVSIIRDIVRLVSLSIPSLDDGAGSALPSKGILALTFTASILSSELVLSHNQSECYSEHHRLPKPYYLL